MTKNMFLLPEKIKDSEIHFASLILKLKVWVNGGGKGTAMTAKKKSGASA